MKMNRLMISLGAVVCLIVFASLVPAVLAGDGPPAPTSSASQFRRTVDPSDRSASGSAILQKKGGKQTVQVAVKGLSDGAYGLFIGPFPTFTTNVLVFDVAPLSRGSAKKGTWSRSFESTGGAPIEFDVDDLDDLAGTFLTIARPGDPELLMGITNVVGSVTNVIYGETLPLDDETNTVLAVLWAPVTALSSNPSADSYSRKASLTLPGEPLPSPSASGLVRTKFNGSQGQSVLDISATGLISGQEYSVWIDDGNKEVAFIPAGDMVTSGKGSSARYIRDTKFGDPLPQQVGSVSDLSGRTVLIRDSFGDVHLQGTIP